MLFLVVAATSCANGWTFVNTDPVVSREGVRMGPRGGNHKGSNVALALARGVRFARGTIDVDLKGLGAEQASFVGVAFHVVDDKRFESVYFRPFRFQGDEVQRSHAVQYVAWPDHTWEALRNLSPGVYEAPIQPVPDPAGWFHARVEVTDDRVRVFVDGAATPCLDVARLGADHEGAVGLFADSQEGSFAHLKIVSK
jgi:hypothetical protein